MNRGFVMQEGYTTFYRWAHENLDDIQITVSIPTIWSLITTTFFLDVHKSQYTVNAYPVIYYGLSILLLLLVLFSIITHNMMLRRTFYLIMIFGAIYSAIDTYQFAHELNITVGLFFYLATNAVYGFLRISFTKKKVTNHVQPINR